MIMKKFLCIVSFLFISPFFSSLRAETVRNFNSVINIRADGIIDVSESIIYDFESEERHGIFRDLKEIKVNTQGKKFKLDYEIIDIRDEQGKTYQWKQETNGEYIRLRIGDADTTVTGVKTYVIHYLVSGALTYFSDHDELYWNVTGNEWNVPILQATTKVTLPKSIDPQFLKLVCYTGSTGSTNSNCISSVDQSSGVSAMQSSLGAGEGLTIAFSFPLDTTAVLEPKEVHNIFENPLAILLTSLFSIIWYIGIPFYIGYRWWKYGRDPKPTIGQASVWFDPPKTRKLRKLTPGETGTLLDEQADIRDIAATIVDLARRGFLTITESKKEYILTKASTIPKESLESFEKVLYDGIFEDQDIVDIKKSSLVVVVEKVKKELYGAVVSEGFFSSNPETTRSVYILFGVLGLITGNIPLFFSCLIFGRFMPKKTPYGADQAAIGKALKSFLSSQERFLKFQAEKMMMFEKLLPYAVAFGVEKVWAKRFENLNLKQPEWYISSHPYTTPVAFVSGLSNSINSVRSAATPTSSSSGFSSGSSGGFSGGGGGGGGGGSW